MNWLFELPLEFRTAVVWIVGAVVGGQINRGIYRLAWHPRPIGPWSQPHPDAPPRQRIDRVPIFGWWLMRREASVHGPGFWVRPLFIELLAACGFATLYWFEMRGALTPRVAMPLDPKMLHCQFVSHFILFSLMAVATFIDFDEKTIPDAITFPGTLLGLLLMTLLPAAALPVLQRDPPPPSIGHLLMTSPASWPAHLNETKGLWIGIGCFVGWIIAVWPKTVTMRRGLPKAITYLLVSMFRYPFWRTLVGIAFVGSLAILGTWFVGGPYWQSQLTALVGMAFGGGLIWAIRVVGGGALGKEAMGFGDVTLMAMIGTYVGWQPSLMIFFLAPFVAVVICLIQWMVTQRRDIAFGPYLCVAAVLVIVRWPVIWEAQARPIFGLGFMPYLLFFCLVLMGGLLLCWRTLERLIVGRD